MNNKDYIEDGCGSTWSRKCPTCGLGLMSVVRPGSARCDFCADYLEAKAMELAESIKNDLTYYQKMIESNDEWTVMNNLTADIHLAFMEILRERSEKE